MKGHRRPSEMRIASAPCTGAPCGCPLRISQNGGGKYSFGRAHGINNGTLFTRAGTRHGRAQGSAPTRTPRRASPPFGNAHRLRPVYGRPLWVPSSDFAKRRKKIFIWAGARHKQRHNIHQGGHKARAGTRHRPYTHPRRASRPFGNVHRLGPVYGRPLWVPSSDFAKRQRKIFIWAGARHKQRRIIHQGGHKARAGTRHRPYTHPRRASPPFGNVHRLGPVYGRPLWVPSSDLAKRRKKNSSYGGHTTTNDHPPKNKTGCSITEQPAFFIEDNSIQYLNFIPCYTKPIVAICTFIYCTCTQNKFAVTIHYH